MSRPNKFKNPISCLNCEERNKEWRGENKEEVSSSKRLSLSQITNGNFC